MKGRICAGKTKWFTGGRLLILFCFGAGFLLSGLVGSRVGLAKIGIGGILKGGAIAIAVKSFGDEINDGINTVLANNNVPAQAETKVVPILSLGSGGYIGAAQVIGPKEQVKKVNAVVQIEASFHGKMFRTKVLVPVKTESLTDIDRVEGVGISAVIDVRI